MAAAVSGDCQRFVQNGTFSTTEARAGGKGPNLKGITVFERGNLSDELKVPNRFWNETESYGLGRGKKRGRAICPAS